MRYHEGKELVGGFQLIESPMPSYFFHIAFDIYISPRPDPVFLFPIFEQFSISFTTIAGRRFVSPETSVLPLESHHLKGSTGEQRPPASTVRDNGANDVKLPGSIPDWRYDRTFAHIFDMAHVPRVTGQHGRGEGGSDLANGITTGLGGLATKGKFESSNVDEQDLGWGIIRLYRDNEETPGLYDEVSVVKGSKGGRTRLQQHDGHDSPFRDEDCTTLCILAVPSYLTPSDFLAFVGEKTREEVSHFRMIRTEKNNRYMVLMKFRNGRKAREWRREWNGKAFDGLGVYPSIHTPVPRWRVSTKLMQPLRPNIAMWFSSNLSSYGSQRRIARSLLFPI